MLDRNPFVALICHTQACVVTKIKLPGKSEEREEESRAVLTGKYVRGVADQPMDPVEYRSLGWVGMRAERGEDRLEEGQDGGDDTEQCVRLAGAGHPFTELHENARGPGQRQDPGEHHEQTMPLRNKVPSKKIIFVTQGRLT